MAERISTMDVRARIGDLVNRVALRNDEFIIERKGQPLAVLISIERYEQMRNFERQQALAYMERPDALGNQLTDEEVMEIALEAQRDARREIREKAAKAKTAPRPPSGRTRKR